MDNPKVSILVSVHNTIDYLDRFFNSLFSQKYQNLEILILDDGSTDGSIERIEAEAKKDQRIHFTKWPKKILPDEARKELFAISTGKYVIYLDSDDEFSNDYISSMVELAEKNNLDFAISSCQRITENNKVHKYISRPDKKEVIFKSANSYKKLMRARYGGWNRLARADYLRKLYYDFSQAELPLFFIEFYKNTRIGFTPHGKYYYRIRKTSISQTGVPARISKYEILAPLSWLKEDQIDKSVYKFLGVYASRMIIPFALYKAAYLPDYNYREEIKTINRLTHSTFLRELRYLHLFSIRDKIITMAFMFHFYGLIIKYIKHKKS